MALRETDDVETKLGPFGPVNITMKVALQQFVFECVCVVPMFSRLLLCSRLLYTEDLLGAFCPRVNDEKKSLMRASCIYF
jgi:hypothetical protein